MPEKLLYLFLIAAVSGAPFSSVGLRQYSGPGIIVRYEPPLEKAAIKLSGWYPGIRAGMEAKFGWRVKVAPVVVLIRQRGVFMKWARNELITAFAVAGENLIVMDYSKMDRSPFDLRATFEHELCHLLLHQNLAPSVIPKWLDEGVAQWASGGIAELLNPAEKDILKQAVLSNNLLALKDIASTFPEESRGLLLSYEESRSFVEFIVHEYGAGKLLSVLNGLKNGGSIEEGVYENLSTEMNALEQRWRKGLLRKYSWPFYLAEHIYWILFFAAALTTLVGYLRLRRHMKNYKDEGDDAPSGEGI